MTVATGVIRSQKVLVSGLRLDAMIGVHDHERARLQPLVLDVEVDLAPEPVTDLASTFNYEAVIEASRDIVGRGHIDLVETLVLRLAEACLAQPAARRVRVRAMKPQALSPDAEAAGVEIVLERRAT